MLERWRTLLNSNVSSTLYDYSFPLTIRLIFSPIIPVKIYPKCFAAFTKATQSGDEPWYLNLEQSGVPSSYSYTKVPTSTIQSWFNAKTLKKWLISSDYFSILFWISNSFYNLKSIFLSVLPLMMSKSFRSLKVKISWLISISDLLR